MAVRTVEGSVRPEWQAEPVDAATAWARASRSSPSTTGEADVEGVRKPAIVMAVEGESGHAVLEL
jgi:hypothetical protein